MDDHDENVDFIDEWLFSEEDIEKEDEEELRCNFTVIEN